MMRMSNEWTLVGFFFGARGVCVCARKIAMAFVPLLHPGVRVESVPRVKWRHAADEHEQEREMSTRLRHQQHRSSSSSRILYEHVVCEAQTNPTGKSTCAVRLMCNVCARVCHTMYSVTMTVVAVGTLANISRHACIRMEPTNTHMLRA